MRIPVVASVAFVGLSLAGFLGPFFHDTSTVSAVPPPRSLVPGDINTDGKVDALDVQLVVNAVLGIPVSFTTDLNRDGATNAIDIQMVINTVLGIAVDFGLPPDPSKVATPVDPTVATSFATSTAFLYAGTNPVQTGVTPDAIDGRRVAVLRGQVMGRDGQPIAAVNITILNHPELGQTATRNDGMFDIAVNGGGALTVAYSAQGLISVQRSVDVPWQDYVFVPDVVMVAQDSQVTAIDFSEPVQAAQGSPVSDADGTRRATLLFPQGAKARMVLRGGATKSLTKLSVRATEFTAGDTGPLAMPAQLPPNSGYTYCVDLSADEATKAQAVGVTFSQPVYLYVENFLGFAVGDNVPSGSYDATQASWIPSPNGRVVKVVAVTNGAADLDTDGDGVADNDPALGITDAERAKLATLYTAGQTLWRVPIEHFSPWDCNWPFGPPPGATQPNVPDPQPPYTPGPCDKPGSIIDAQNMALGEDVAVSGTEYNLHYQSDRELGRLDAYSLDIPLTGASTPPSLQEVTLAVQVAGRLFTKSFHASPNLHYVFTWDGKDAYGRVLQGVQRATIDIGYGYLAVYMTSAQQQNAFDRYGNNVTAVRTRNEVLLSQHIETTIGVMDARADGLGGWLLDIHHVYDPIRHILYLGDGTQRSAKAIGNVMSTFAGTGGPCSQLGGCSDGLPATQASLGNVLALAVGPDGAVYTSNATVIQRIGPDGILTTIAGKGGNGFGGDKGPALDAKFSGIRDLAFGPDGSLYVCDQGNNRIRRIFPDGTVDTVAGDGNASYAGDDGPAIQAEISSPNGMDVGPDGTIYIADSANQRYRKISPDGVISTIAGNGANDATGDGGRSTDAAVSNPFKVRVAPNGDVYLLTQFGGRLRKVTRDGIITTVVATDGSGSLPSEQHNDLRISTEGAVYMAGGFSTIERVAADGSLVTVAGVSNQSNYNGDNLPATQATLAEPTEIAFTPDGKLLIADNGHHRLRKVDLASPSFVATKEEAVASEDGREVYIVDDTGRHLRTLDAFTTAVLYTFDYDGAGRLAQVTDVSGNVTRVNRDANGNLMAVVAPGGQQTSFAIDANGYLTSIADPAGDTIHLGYAAGGLLASLQDPRNNTWLFTYDALGRLVKDEDPAGGSTTLTRTDAANGFTVDLETALGRTTSYSVEVMSSGEVVRTTTDPSGDQTQAMVELDNSRTVSYPDGTTATSVPGPDPRWGMLAPVAKTATIATPGGLTATMTASRTATLADATNPLSLQTETDSISINGRVYTRTYDASQHRYTLTSPGGRVLNIGVDPQGRPLSVAFGQAVAGLGLTYDAQGRLTRLDRGSLNWAFTYDALNRLVKRVDAAGGQVAYTYDAAGRPVTLTTPGGHTYQFAHDANGNVTQVTMPSGAVHTLAHTEINKPATYTPPSSAGFAWTYDTDRMRVRTTLPSGRTVDYAYDAAGRPSGISYSGAAVTFVTGGLISGCCGDSGTFTSVTRTPSTGTAETVAFTYDGNLVTQAAWTGAATGTYAYRYDKNFFLLGLQLDSETELATPRDADGLLTGYGPFTITRSAQTGLPTQMSDGTGKPSLSFDSTGRLTARGLMVGSTSAYVLSLGYDTAGRLAHKSETVSGTNHVYDYAYDADGELVQVKKDNAVVETYAYDVDGNRTAASGATATYDNQDRLTGRASIAYTFDADGFLASRGSDTFTYSARGELLQAVVAGGTVSYGYDGLGRRVARTDGSGTTTYLYGNPSQPFQITAIRSAANVLTQYLYDEAGIPFAFNRGGTWYYVAADALGTPHTVFDNGGQAVKALDYDAFGVLLSDSAPSFDLPIGFAGGLDDRATGLVLFGQRDYEPASGRWTARDPILFAGHQGNLYAYCANNPATFVDPTGTACVGFSGYGGIGGGGQICVNGDGFSVCGEVGFGAGGGLNVDPFGHLAREGQYLDLSLGASVGPLGVGGTETLDDCGDTKFKPNCSFGPFGCSGSIKAKPKDFGKGIGDVLGGALDKALTPNDGGKLLGGSFGEGFSALTQGIKVQAKISGRACAQGSW